MNNFRQRGDVIDYIVPSAGIKSGDIVVAGGLIGIAVCDGILDDVVAVKIEGVFDLKKPEGVPITYGSVVFYDETNNVVTSDDASGQNPFVGYAVADSEAAFDRCSVKLIQRVATSDSGSTSVTWGSITGVLNSQTDLQTAFSLKANAADLTSHTASVNNPHAVTKAQVGLSNVDNTSDANKPVSTAMTTALNAKLTATTAAFNAKLTASKGAAVADATSETDVVAQFNALLASLRTAGIINV